MRRRCAERANTTAIYCRLACCLRYFLVFTVCYCWSIYGSARGARSLFSGLKAQYSNHINYGALFPYIGGDRDNRNPKPSACKADALPLELYPQTWCWQRDSNSQPTVYKTVALPLCYASCLSLFTIELAECQHFL